MKIHYKLQEENSEKFTTLGQAKIQKHEPYKNRNTEIVNHTSPHKPYSIKIKIKNIIRKTKWPVITLNDKNHKIPVHTH